MTAEFVRLNVMGLANNIKDYYGKAVVAVLVPGKGDAASFQFSGYIFAWEVAEFVENLGGFTLVQDEKTGFLAIGRPNSWDREVLAAIWVRNNNPKATEKEWQECLITALSELNTEIGNFPTYG